MFWPPPITVVSVRGGFTLQRGPGVTGFLPPRVPVELSTFPVKMVATFRVVSCTSGLFMSRVVSNAATKLMRFWLYVTLVDRWRVVKIV